MIIYSKSLYCDEKVSGHKAKAMKKGIKGDYYFIRLPEDDKNLLEIIEAQYLRQSYYKNKDIYVAGLAETKETALELVRRIIEECCSEDGVMDIKGALFNL